MITRRRLITAMAAGAIARSPHGLAQQRGKTYRIGSLSAGSFDGSQQSSAWQATLDGLREYGYEEGKNLAFIFRKADGQYDRLPRLAAELVALKPDLLLSGGTPALLALKNATTTLPIVMVVSGDAVATGLVASLARPGGNVTGSTFFGIELMVKRLELLKDVVPQIKRVGVLVNPDNQTTEPVMRAMEASKSLKIELHRFDSRSVDDLQTAFSAMKKQKVSAVIVQEDGIFAINDIAVADLCVRNRLPAIGSTEFAVAGCLMGYGANFVDMYRRAGYFVDRILKGANPADIPVERASSFELALNLKAARTLGMKFPSAILQRADRVIG